MFFHGLIAHIFLALNNIPLSGYTTDYLFIFLLIDGFPLWLSSKEHTRNAGDTEMQVHPWVRKIHWRRAWPPTAVFLPEEYHGQRNRWTSPWNCKELDSAEVILKDILVIFKILAVLNKAVIKWACLVAQTVKNLIAVLVAFKILIVLNKAAINAHAQVFVCMQVFNSFR